MDRRPIVLLRVVYQLWTAVRGRTLREWLRIAGVLRAGATSAVDSLAGLLGLGIVLANAEAVPLVGLALDFPSATAAYPWRCCARSRKGRACRRVYWCRRSHARLTSVALGPTS